MQSGNSSWYQIADQGLTTYRDTAGAEHEVRRVSILNYQGDRRVDYYVSPRPPYWLGLVAHSLEGKPTSVLRLEKYELRGATLSDYTEKFLKKKPGG